MPRREGWAGVVNLQDGVSAVELDFGEFFLSQEEGGEGQRCFEREREEGDIKRNTSKVERYARWSGWK